MLLAILLAFEGQTEVCQDGAWKRANPNSSWGFREGGMPQEMLRMDI